MRAFVNFFFKNFSEIIYKLFRLVQGRLLLVDNLKAVLVAFLWCFVKFIDANFFYYSIHDRFIQRQPCVSVRL